MDEGRANLIFIFLEFFILNLLKTTKIDEDDEL